MRIALYYPWIYLRSGIERTILELTKRSKHDWTILTSRFEPENTFTGLRQKDVIKLRNIPVNRSYLSVLKAAITIAFQKIDMRDFDALWVHSEGLGDFITFRNHKKPIICFCHTPLKVIHDPYAQESYLKNNRFKRPIFKLFSFCFNLVDRLAWRNYRYVFCVSQEIKRRIIKARLTSPEKTEVVYRGVDIQKIRPAWTYQPYFLHPARIKWWKNIELSIEAFKEFRCRFPDFNLFRLIIAGQVDEGSRIYHQKLLNMCKEEGCIEIIPDVSEDRLDQLFKDSYAVLNTTLNEDWGLVPLEAMAYGKPVIAVKQGGPKESILDRKTGLLVEPTVAGFSEAMAALAKDKDLVLSMGKEARQHSLGYDWDNFISQIDSYMDSIKIAP